MSESDGLPLEHARLYRGIIDSHFHSIELRRKGVDADALLSWCFSNGMDAALDISVDAADVDERLALADRFPRLSVAAGYYPSEASRFAANPTEAQKMQDLLQHHLSSGRIAAVGEIGIDRHHDGPPLGEQLRLFAAQVELAAAYGLPVVIHNREADDEVLEVLRSAAPPRGGIMHCFSSSAAYASKCIDLGFLISFAGNVTFRNATVLQESARTIPLRSLLVETDAPYLAPQPVRGRINHPGYIGHTYEFLAGLRRESIDELVAGVADNYYRLLGSSGFGGKRE
ncbi:MAG TPA: TatD family hydrolase [Spirochaetia bacterium]|nr:TatD family hydrolase [Spirochaetia bacterium]